jgi:hypothetical protein
MEEGAKGLIKEVKALPKRIRDADCFQVGGRAGGRLAGWGGEARPAAGAAARAPQLQHSAGGRAR